MMMMMMMMTEKKIHFKERDREQSPWCEDAQSCSMKNIPKVNFL